MRSAAMYCLHASILACVLLAPSSKLNAEVRTGDESKPKVLILLESKGPIRVDGVIEEAWSAADSTTDFFQTQPYFAKEPSRRTVAKVLTTTDALYCLMVCYDDEANIQRNTGMLDQMGGDIVSIMLDTFGDKRTAYKFAVSASGVRNDCRLLDDARNRDYNWDGVWFSAAKIYAWGYVIEMEIPYKSLQYDESLSEWGLDFDRWRPINSEDLYWCRYEENEGQRISKFGKLVLNGLRPTVRGLNLEIYPVGIARGTYIREGTYSIEPDAGLDIFYNPSQKLTFQLTANPDFAQIEADPFNFNISRYESYFDERRPFFTQGNEIFMPSGRQRNTGFYRPMELFYSRRIGRKLPDGQEVPLLAGTKAFGRIEDLEYGGFFAYTDEVSYSDDSNTRTEAGALFGSIRVRQQILGNSSVGFLYVGKFTKEEKNGVIDIDGAFRGSDWQLAYQIARSYGEGDGDYAASAGYSTFREEWFLQARVRYVGKDFDIQQVGFVPWQGTTEFVSLGGPRWYYPEGAMSQFLIYFGPVLSFEEADDYTDYGGLIGWNMQFRSNWGYEVNYVLLDAKDLDVSYTQHDLNLSTWFNVSPKWNASLWSNFRKSYNFSRGYLALFASIGSHVDWKTFDVLNVGTGANTYIEWNPDNRIEDVTLNLRPYFSLTPLNDLNIRVYWDNVYVQSTDRIEQMIIGFLFSYNFSPKSWIYFAINEFRDRFSASGVDGSLVDRSMRVRERVAVVKVKYLYYF